MMNLFFEDYSAKVVIFVLILNFFQQIHQFHLDWFKICRNFATFYN